MNIAFFAEHCIPIHAYSLEDRPLGGTETALIRLAEVLAKRGHEVTVFTSYKNPPPSTPRYVYSREVLKAAQFDIMVLVQDWKPAVLGAPGKRIFYWTGDGFDQYANFGFGDKRAARKIEYLLAVSNWHAESLCEKSGFPISQARVIGNGVHLPYFSGEEKRVRKRLIYTAAPYRGLEFVPPIYQSLKQKHPDAELHIFSGMNIYDREEPFRGPQVEQFKRLSKTLSTLPDCYLHENVRQETLARELMKSSVFIYPNCIFETCCITALEAQAAGCPVVASANSALPETVADAGLLIDGVPGAEDYLRDFTSVVDRLLSDDGLWHKLSQRAAQRTKESYSWEHVADRFLALCA